MNRFNRILLAVLSAVLLSAVQSVVAYGQRTADRQFHVTPSVGGSVAGATGLAADLSFGQYILSSRWDAGVSYGFRAGSASPYHSVMFQCSWLYRVFGTSNRVFSMYCGGGLRAGVDFGHGQPASGMDSSGRNDDVPGSSEDGSEVVWGDFVSKSGSVLDGGEEGRSVTVPYGLHFSFDMEAFVSPRIALVGMFRVPVNFNSVGSLCPAEVLVGLRFNI